MFGETGYLRTTEDVERHDSFDEKATFLGTISMCDYICDHFQVVTYVSTTGIPSTASVLVVS